MRFGLALMLALAGCSSLPDIALGICGNHIVEPGEDCDSIDPRCVQPGQPDACRLRCDAFPGNVCPIGEICDSNAACVRANDVCGNRVVDPGEDCDGSVGCIAPGMPGACHMSCSAFASSICPPKSICDGNGACVTADGTCGNGFVDPGEECDGGPGCIPSGQPAACQLTCAAHPDGHCPAGSICASSGACAAATGVCGNLVVEPGEDCDGSLGCGAPGTQSACRFTCDGTACAPGLTCGNDKICRQATGYFNLSTPIGRADEAFAASDLDGDGILDLIGRGPHETTLWHNDGTGAMSLTATGPTPPRPMDQMQLTPTQAPTQPRPAVAFTNDGDTRIMAALTGGPAELFRVHTPAGATVADLEPLVAPSLYLPNDAFTSFLGLLPPPATGGPPTALFRLFAPVYLELLQPTGNASAPWNQVLLDVRVPCAIAGEMVAYPSLHGSTIELALLVDKRYLCLGEAPASPLTASAFSFQKIDVVGGITQLANSHSIDFDSSATLGQFTTLDIDGDGRLDVMCSISYSFGGAGDPQAASYFLYWLRNSDGTFPATPSVDNYVSGLSSPADALAAHDLDGDHRDDVVFSGFTYQAEPNAPPGPTAIFDPRGNYEYPPVQPTDVTAALFGDVAGTGHAALVQGFSSRTDLIVCRPPLNATGFPKLACDDEATGLTGVTALALSDVSGDGRLDMLSAGNGTPSWGGGAAVSLILGSDGSGSAPAPVLMPAYHGTVQALVPAPSSGALNGFTALMQTDDGRWALAQSYTDDNTGGSFGIPGNFVDARVSDYDGDGVPDLALLGAGVQVVKGPWLDTTPQPPAESFAPPLDHFLDLPGEPHALVIGRTTIDSAFNVMSLGWYDPQPYSPYQFSSTGVAGLQWASKLQDVNGDGTQQLVLYDGDCNVYVGPIVDHVATPTLIMQNPGNYQCADVFFVDVAPLDGIPDVLYEVRIGNELTTHLLLSRARADGTYDGATPLLDPLLAHGAGGPTPMPAGAKWVATNDMNGDGIADLVLWTPDGAIVALAEVVRR